MATKKKLNEELEVVLAKIGKAKRELKALRRHQAEGTKGKPGTGFITGREQMVEVEEAVKRLDTLKQQEREVRAKLQSGKP
jgi:hypothetical protein